jgi:hypothetical protein
MKNTRHPDLRIMKIRMKKKTMIKILRSKKRNRTAWQGTRSDSHSLRLRLNLRKLQGIIGWSRAWLLYQYKRPALMKRRQPKESQV